MVLLHGQLILEGPFDYVLIELELDVYWFFRASKTGEVEASFWLLVWTD